MKVSYKGILVKVFILLLTALTLNAQKLELSSFIVSDNQTTISSKYNGYIEKVFVKEGDIVKKGEMLLKIDSKEITSMKSQILLSIEMAKNEYNKANDDYIRYKELFEKELISKTNFEKIELKKENLYKQLAQLKDKLSEIEKQFKYLNIKAPTNAMVISKKINEGELAVATTPLMTIVDIDNLVIYLDVAESDLKYFRNKKDVLVSIDSLNIDINAKIIAILPSVDVNNSFKVKIGFKSNNKDILPGMYAKVTIEQ